MQKNLLSLFIAFLCFFSITNAQIANYKFSASNGGGNSAYQSITGTPLNYIRAGTTTADGDEGVAAFPIGFTFNYNGTNYTTVTASANGFLTFATAVVNMEGWTNTLTGTAALNTGFVPTPRPVLAPFWDDMDNTGGGSSYELTGTAPTRVLTVQWNNQKWQYSAAAAAISYQVKLYETSNIIEFLYKQEAGAPDDAGDNNFGASIGITATTIGVPNFQSVNGTLANSTVSTTTETSNIITKPATSQIYRWDPKYCAAGSSVANANAASGTELITNVTLNTINNSTTTAGFSQYENFTNQVTNLTPTNSYPLSVTLGGGNYDADQVIVFIDYNADGDFDDAGETVFTGNGGGPFSGNITIPATATLGFTRMRVRLHDTSTGPNATACGSSSWGQVEDYTINISLCSPVVVSTQPSNATVCQNGNGSITVAGAGNGITYTWQMSTDGGTTYAAVPNAAPYSGVSSNTLVITGATAAMSGNLYRVSFGGTCTPANTFSNAATLTVNAPATVTNPADAVACTGSNATLTVTGGGTSPTYQWQQSADGITFTNTVDGAGYSGSTTNTLTVVAPPFSSNGYKYIAIVNVATCASATSDTATLTVKALPTASLVASPYTKLYPGLTTGIKATSFPAGANNVYQWYKDGVLINGATTDSIPVNVDGLGVYTAKTTDALGCTSLASAGLVIGDAVTSTLFIYPNPAPNGVFQVRFYSVANNVLARTLTVYDSKGAKVFSELFSIPRTYGQMNVQLNTGRGVYRVELGDLNGNRIAVGSVIVL